MPYLTNPLTHGWAVIDVLVGVSRLRRQVLQRNSFPVPHPVPVRALIDTGASISGFSPRVFRELGISPVGTTPVLTPSTRPDAPHECDLYDVTLSIVAEGSAHLFPDARVMEADCWLPGEGIEALIGTDILNHCFFQFIGRDRTFTLAF
ncbi:MAG TPA: hypothetical protein VM533_11475 [Fimbriiglobus sp.]|nr:hypothetical protein [Fimbriiglobus sp.]